MVKSIFKIFDIGKNENLLLEYLIVMPEEFIERSFGLSKGIKDFSKMIVIKFIEEGSYIPIDFKKRSDCI